jgi:hypothetical protein
MIGATSATRAGQAGSFALVKAGLRCLASRSSANVTSPIMRS